MLVFYRVIENFETSMIIIIYLGIVYRISSVVFLTTNVRVIYTSCKGYIAMGCSEHVKQNIFNKINTMLTALIHSTMKIPEQGKQTECVFLELSISWRKFVTAPHVG